MYLYEMKGIQLVILMLFSGHSGNTQSLEGKWKGYYSTEYSPIGYINQPIKSEIPISLEFKINGDGSYLVHSYTVFGRSRSKERDTVICLMKTEIKGDSVFLQETLAVNSNNDNLAGLQKMSLKLIRTRKRLKLEGRWEDVTNGNMGNVFFNKRD